MESLRAKFRGCIAGSWVGSAMGAAVEGWSAERIEREHGTLEKLLPYKHYTDVTDWQRPPGTTEDGIERQKLIAKAILEKGGRIQAHDLLAVWKRDLDPAKMLYKQEAFDRSLLELARAGVPPVELGRLWPFPNVVSVARASHPLGLINAGDPKSAADDTFEVGKVYAFETAFALRWAALYNAGIAAACRPGATVESVLETIRTFATYRAEAGSLYAGYDWIRSELDRALAMAAEHRDRAGLRAAFARHYHGGDYIVYAHSQANEVVCKGLAAFAHAKGDPREAIVTAVNYGRDTDCAAAVAGGLSGALRGIGGLPREWIEQVNQATREDAYTNDHRTIEETADGLFQAYVRRHNALREYVDAMGSPSYLS